jgi:trk system potassium uptake protein TrkH
MSGLTAACAVSLWLAGMSAFDAIGHSFSALSTGGFSTHDASIAYFGGVTIPLILTLFMYLGGVNFGLHFLLFRNRSARSYLRDSEFRVYTMIVLSVSAFVIVMLRVTDTYTNWSDALLHGLFQTVSMQTSTGSGSVRSQAGRRHCPCCSCS